MRGRHVYYPVKGSVQYQLAGAFHRLAWTEVGEPEAPPVICVHGLTRNGWDFYELAQVLGRDFRVISPDLPGRGESEWLPDPALYQASSYVQALTHLLAMLDRPVHWVGTSLGGICGMLVASSPGQPIQRLVLNDVGPFIPAAALARIRGYIGDTPEFSELSALEAHLRKVHAPFGPLTNAQWRHLALHSARTLPNGNYALHYDPAIAKSILAGEPEDAVMWPVWERITVPTLTIRGATSDLLQADTMARMGGSTHVVRDAGHAPALMDAPTIGVIQRFLTALKE